MSGYTRLDNQTDLATLLELPNGLIKPYLYLLSRRNLRDDGAHWGLIAAACKRGQTQTNSALRELEKLGMVQEVNGLWSCAGIHRKPVGKSPEIHRKPAGNPPETRRKPDTEPAKNDVLDAEKKSPNKRTKGTKRNERTKEQIHVAEATSVHPAVESTEPICETKNSALDTKKRKPSLDYDAFLSIWNAHCGNLPAVSALNTIRRKKLRLFVKDCDSDIEKAKKLFKDAVKEVSQDAFWQERRYGLDNIFGKIHQKAESWQSRQMPENKTPQNDDDDKDDYTMAELFSIARGAKA